MSKMTVKGGEDRVTFSWDGKVSLNVSNKYFEVKFVEFLECLGRLTYMIYIPKSLSRDNLTFKDYLCCLLDRLLNK